MSGRAAHRLVFAAALLWGLSRAIDLRWLSDDAFISFRYARHLAEGEGLVFNVGERVEGYTNFLWTVLMALPHRAGVDVGAFSHGASIGAFAVTLVLLLVFHERLRERTPPAPAGWVPISAIGLAVHPDAQIFATSGLETALFAALCTAAFVVVTAPRPSARSLGAAGLLLGLATLTRPEGILFAALISVYVTRIGRARGLVPYALALGLLVVPHQVFRLVYYGDPLPNTYYAKSAGAGWWSQGLEYIGLYVERYAILVVAPAAVGLALVWRRRAGARAKGRIERPWDLALCWGIVLAHALYVAEVGGDFMFARFLIPTTPFLLMGSELLLAEIVTRLRTSALIGGQVAYVGLVALVPSPIGELEAVAGIVDERAYYTRPRESLGGMAARQFAERQGRLLAELIRGLDVRLVGAGSQSRMMYRARVPTVIDFYGLTDRVIARRPLPDRGRVGHEKSPPLSYLMERRAHFCVANQLYRGGPIVTHVDPILNGRVPDVTLEYRGLVARFIHWDPDLAVELRKRGARVTDFEALVDAFVANLDRMPKAAAREGYAALRTFYFQHHDDPREETIRAHLVR